MEAKDIPRDGPTHERRTPMLKILRDVSMFHVACDVPIASSPGVPPPDRVALRRSLIDEEVNKELLPAMEAGDVHAVADGMVDAIYVIAGAALEYGIPLDRVWDAVQAANMRKVDPDTRKVRLREDGKVLKPEGWAPPDIAAAMEPPPYVGHSNDPHSLRMTAFPEMPPHEMWTLSVEMTGEVLATGGFPIDREVIRAAGDAHRARLEMEEGP